MRRSAFYTLCLCTTIVVIIGSCGNNKAASKPANSARDTAVTAAKGQVSELTTEEFKRRVMNYDLHPNEWIFEGTRPALIDFYATWCGPCKKVAPIVASMAQKYGGKMDFYKVDVDEQEELASLFGINSIPTLLFIPTEGKPHMQIGLMDSMQMDSIITHVLLPPAK